jgi:undecaprenyl-diphosphatase
VVRFDLRAADVLSRTPFPAAVDRGLPILTRAADYSVLWFTAAAGLAATRRPHNTRAAVRGLVTLGATSLLANQGGKRLWPRRRPIINALPAQRVPFRVPRSGSFPSGHAASAAAFAIGAAVEQPRIAAPLGALAVAVAFSRVYTGVHHPSDVVAGAAIGAGLATLGTKVVPTARGSRGRAVAAAAPPRPQQPRATGRGVVVVVNPRSGTGRAGAVAAAFAEQLEHATVREVGEQEEVADVLAEAARQAEVLGVAGGDGTVNAAARVAMAADLPLLVLPGGTFNHFARNLGIGRLGDAAAALRDGTAVRVDVGRADGRIFLNTASVGSYPRFVEIREQWQARIGKPLAAALALVRTIRECPPLRVRVDGVERSLLMAFIGNGDYVPSGYVPRSRPRLDSGRLDVRLVESGGGESVWRLLGQAVTGRLVQDGRFSAWQTPELALTLDGSDPSLACDGEVFPADQRIGLRVDPQALTVYSRPPRAGRRQRRQPPIS